MPNNAGKTVATLLIGAAIGAAAGYILGTDKDTRQDQIDRLKANIDRLKNKLTKKTADIEDEIFSA